MNNNPSEWERKAQEERDALAALARKIAEYMPGWATVLDEHRNVDLVHANGAELGVYSEWNNKARVSVSVSWPREGGENGQMVTPSDVWPRPEGWDEHPTRETSFAKDRDPRAIAAQVIRKLDGAIGQWYVCRDKAQANVSRRDTATEKAESLAKELGGRMNTRGDKERPSFHVPDIYPDFYTYNGDEWTIDGRLSCTADQLRQVVAILKGA